MFTPSTPGWKGVSEKKRNQRDDAIKRIQTDHPELVDGAANEKHLRYLKVDASQIVKNIENGIWTATDVMKAYIWRCIVAQEATNCITEVRFDSALEEARQLDEKFKNTGKIVGRLHGVPVSAKDLYRIKGYDSTIGYTTWDGNATKETAEIINIISEAGGIVLVKTNVPQTMLSFECNNPLWGRTLNPHRSPHDSIPDKYVRNFTCGGSSGGEAALLACDGSALGLGSDIGGSLRIPSAFCGTYAIKPSPGRMSHVGLVSPQEGFNSIPVCQGPMGRSVADIRLGCEVLLGQGKCINQLKYRPEVTKSIKDKGKLRFGYYLSDGVVKASPACQRAVLDAVEALKAKGHECIPVVPPDVKEALGIFVGLTSADGYESLQSHLGDDPKDDSLKLVTLGPQIPSIAREIGAWMLENWMEDAIFAHSVRNSKHKTPGEVMKLIQQKDAYTKRFEETLWDEHKLDGIICPVLAAPALPHGKTKYLSPLAIGTFLYNVVDSSVGVIPVTRVDQLKDQLGAEWVSGSKIPSREPSPTPPTPTNRFRRPFSMKSQEPSTPTDETPQNDSLEPPGSPVDTGPHGSRMIEETLYKGNKPVYDPKAMHGLPVGVQIVGRCNEDEKVIQMMQIVDDALKGDRGTTDFGPGSSSRYLDKAA